MGGVFFVNWALWEEMTFVLACAIVVVFLIGLFKLWLSNRQLRKHEVLDEEKKARLAEMKKAGLPPKKRNNIPFGVRAIESGIEIDGIWISRPNTPSRSSTRSRTGLLSSATTPVDDGYNGKATSNNNNGKQKQMATAPEDDGGQGSSAQRVVSDSNNYSSTGMEPVDTHSNMSTPLPQISENSAFLARHHNASASAGSTGDVDPLNEESLRQLEGHYAPTTNRIVELPSELPTYIPSSRASPTSPRYQHANYSRPHSHHSHSHSHSHHSHHSQYQSQYQPLQSYQPYGAIAGHYRPREHGSTGSADSASSGSRSVRSVQSNSSSSYPTRPVRYAPMDKAPMAGAVPAGNRVNLNAMGLQAVPRDAAAVAAAAATSVPQPGAAFGVDGQGPYANRVSRKVNAGFEVLPAGTFGGPMAGGGLSRNSSSNSADDEADESEATKGTTTVRPARNKLRKSAVPSSQP